MKAVKCPQPKCKSAARFTITLGEVDWYICTKCKFTFPNDNKARKR